jgi:tetratricopeptide (TPR) repeat protein
MANARELLRALARLGMREGDEEETWSSVAADAKTDFSLQAATQRLQTALLRQETIAARSGTRRKLMVAAAATAAAIAAGALLAWWTHEPFALAGADGTRTHVEKQATAMEQHLYASTLNTEEGWLSVREYFPNEPFYIRLADQQLARLYLHQGDYARARRIFQQFADMDESEESFRAFGLAGLCVVNSFEDHPHQSAEALNQLFGLRRHLDPQMRQLVQLAVQRNREKFNPREVQAWQEWFERQAAEEVQRAE